MVKAPGSAKKQAPTNVRRSKLRQVLDTNPCEDPDKPLVQAQHERDQAKSRRKKATDTSIEAKVAKCIRDNFDGFSEEQLYSKRVAGQTLYQKLFRDKSLEAANPCDSPVKFGKNYFSKLRLDYSADDMAEGLDVADESVLASPKLLEAVTASRSGTGARDKLVQWLQAAGLPNQTELVGLLSHLLELRPRSGGSQFTVCLEGLKFLVRTKVPQRYEKEFQCYKKQADRTLVYAWTTMKAKGFSLQSFWAAYKPLAATVLNATIVDSLLKAKSSWADYQGDLQVVAKSELGESMFSFALAANTAHEASATIDDMIKVKLNATRITEDMVALARQQIIAEVEKLPNRSMLNVPRLVDMCYRDHTIKIKAKSLVDEVNLRVDIFVRNMAIGYKPEGQGAPALTPLFCEMALVPFKASGIQVDDDCLSAINAARASANEFLAQEYHDSGSQVVQSLAENESVYDMIDPSFRIEIAWFSSMNTDGARHTLEGKVLSLLPTSEIGAKACDVAASLGALKGEPVYRFCGTEPQSSVNIASAWVQAIANCRQPSLVGSEGAFLCSVSERLAFFLEFENAANQVVLRGKEAVAPMLEQITSGADQQVQTKSLKLFSVFSWLLTDAQRRDVQAVVTRMARGGGGGAVSSSSSVAATLAPSTGSGPPPSAAKKRAAAKAAPAESDQATLSLFKKRHKK